MRLKIPKIKRKLKSALAMCLCVSMLAPTIAKGVISDDLYQRPEVAQSWTDAANAMALSKRYKPSGLAVAWYSYPMFNNQGGISYPLGQAMAFEERPGYTADEECKPFIGRYAYCVNGHVPNYLVYEGMQFFLKGKYNTGEIPDFIQGTSEENKQFNFLMLAIACGYPTKYTVGSTDSIAYNLIDQTIAWVVAGTSGGFTGAPKDLQEGSIKNYFMADLQRYHASDEYKALGVSFSAKASPEIRSFLDQAPPASSGAAKMGLTNMIDATFYDIWMAAYLTSKLTPDWQTYITSAYTTAELGDDGYYHAYVPLFQCQEAEIYLNGMKPQTLGDWEFVGNEPSASGNGTMVQHFKSPTGETENGEICTLSWEGTDSLGALMPIDQTKAKLFLFTFFNGTAAAPTDFKFNNAQDRFSSVIESGLTVHVRLGAERDSELRTEVKRHEHEESWNATYNVNLYKFDSETGKPLANSHWDVLERFDDSQLDNTDLDREPENPGEYTSGIGSLKSTDWGDDTVEDNYDGDMGVVTSDTNKYNWANDNGTQFETWDDEHDDPCDRDDNVTGEDGKLYEIDSNGNNSGEAAHTDIKSYVYHKGYCDGHPAPEIEYIECDHDADEECDCEELNQEIHDTAWAEWYKEVETCEQLVEEGGFFHCISTDGAAKQAMEEDRDQFYKDFISLTYEYSAEEIMAPKGYAIHGTHTDDIPIEWRNVTSSEYKDTEEANTLEHNESSSTDTEDGDTDEGYDDGDIDAGDDGDEGDDDEIDTENLIVTSSSRTVDTSKAVYDDITDEDAISNKKEKTETTTDAMVATSKSVWHHYIHRRQIKKC